MLAERRKQKEEEEQRSLFTQFLASIDPLLGLQPGESVIRKWATRWHALKPELGTVPLDQLRSRRMFDLVGNPTTFVHGASVLSNARFAYFAQYATGDLQEKLKAPVGAPTPAWGPGTPYWSSAKPLLSRPAQLVLMMPLENLHVLFAAVQGTVGLTFMASREGVFGIFGDSTPEVVAMIRNARDQKRAALGLPALIRPKCGYCGASTDSGTTRCASCGAPIVD